MNFSIQTPSFFLCANAALAIATTAHAQTTTPTEAAKPQDWNFHLQSTAVEQADTRFHSAYDGPNSLSSRAESQYTTNLDLFAGKRLWKGAEWHVDGLFWAGHGLSQTLGVEAFPSGEAYKYGTDRPYFMFARLFIRQTFGLGGRQEDIPDGQLSLAGKQDIHRITITAGRFSPTDISDTNSYANSSHTQFLNWGMINNLTWDYAADSVGFAPGVTVELNQEKWALRYGLFALPSLPNSFTGDDQFLMWPHEGHFGPLFKEWAMNTELEQRYVSKGHPGSVRYQAWLNEAHMASYADATAILKAGGPTADYSAARSYRTKYGFGLNWEQELTSTVGVFSRLGWNDGKEEAWAFTDANWSASLGFSLKGDTWHRSSDTVGIAAIVSGASSEQQTFLKAGGLGILDGDGNLKYAPEGVLEAYYDAQITKQLRLGFDYQLVINPAFNSSRGPVSVFGLRVHYEF